MRERRDGSVETREMIKWAMEGEDKEREEMTGRLEGRACEEKQKM